MVPEEHATAATQAGQAVHVVAGHGWFQRRDHEHTHGEEPERPAVRGQTPSDHCRRRPPSGSLQVRACAGARRGKNPRPECRGRHVDPKPESESGKEEMHEGRTGRGEEGNRHAGAGRRERGRDERGPIRPRPRGAAAGARREPEEPDREQHRDEVPADGHVVGRSLEDRRVLHRRDHVGAE